MKQQVFDARQWFGRAEAIKRRLNSKPEAVQQRYRRFVESILQRQPLPF